jgi:hypothetical protein
MAHARVDPEAVLFDHAERSFVVTGETRFRSSTSRIAAPTVRIDDPGTGARCA